MTHSLQTTRLHLRPCELSDIDFVHKLWIHADIRQFLFDDRQISREEAQSFIEASSDSFKNHGYGIWLFFEHDQEDAKTQKKADVENVSFILSASASPHPRKNGQVAGFTGLLQYSEDSPSLIFGVQPAFWGRGYATEATNAVINYAFTVLDIKHIIADVDEPNDRSIRVLERLGMSRIQSAIVNERPLLYYEIYAP